MGRKRKPKGDRTWSVSTRSHLPESEAQVVALYDLRRSQWIELGWTAENYLTVGSAPSAHLRVADPTVSAIHCMLTRTESDRITLSEAVVETSAGDIRPRNGTYINGVRLLGECELHPGLAITLGRTILIAASSTGHVPNVEVVAATRGDFVRRAVSMFRSAAKAAQSVGIAYRTLKRWEVERS